MKPFNSAFYYTVATVIPVWFIALGQTDFFASSILGVRIARRHRTKPQGITRPDPRLARFGLWMAGHYVYWLLVVVYLSGFVGETIALMTLANQKSDRFTQDFLILVTAILISSTVFSMLNRAAVRANEIEAMQHEQGLPASIEVNSFFGKFTLIEPVERPHPLPVPELEEVLQA